MTGFNVIWVLIIAFISRCNSGTLGKALGTDNNQKGVYANNPFLNSSYPAEQYRHTHYPGHHHHHDCHHNHDDMANSNDRFPEQQSDNDFRESTFPDQFPEGPKITARREITDDVVPNYPYDEIRNFLDKNPVLKQYFDAIPKIGNRDGAPDEGETLCKMQIIRTFRPKSLKNVNNIDRLIVNDDQNYQQAIEQTLCANNNGECDIPFAAFGYTSFCHQNFDNKRLMVYDNSTKNFVFDEFKVPSCCVCKIKKI